MHDTTCIVITDVEITKRIKDGVIVLKDSRQVAKQGIGGVVTQTLSKITDRKQFRLRVISTATRLTWIIEKRRQT